MKTQLLQNPLDKGESWEGKSRREIEITKSGDNRGMKPTVYFSINTPHWPGKSPCPMNAPMKIGEDLFLTTEMAITIGKQLIKQAKDIDKEHKKEQERLVDKYKKKRGEIARGERPKRKRLTRPVKRKR